MGPGFSVFRVMEGDGMGFVMVIGVRLCVKRVG